METFASKLKELRDKSGLSQAGLASASTVPVTTIRDLEQGKRQPTFANAYRLAKALGVSLDEFPPPPDTAGRKPYKAADKAARTAKPSQQGRKK